MDFKQQKTDLNAERKKNALLEQKLREMEAALATGRISSTSKEIIPMSNGDSTNTAATLTKTITITTLAFGKAQVLAEETFTQLVLPPTRTTILMLAAEAAGWNKKLLAALGLSQNSLIPVLRNL